MSRNGSANLASPELAGFLTKPRLTRCWLALGLGVGAVLALGLGVALGLAIGLGAEPPDINLFNWGGRAISIGPTVRWELFQGGRILANVDAHKAVRQVRDAQPAGELAVDELVRRALKLLA